MDAVSRRQLVLAIFALVQSAKLLDFYHGKDSAVGIIAKWAVIETAFLLILWKAKVPRLSFTMTTTILISLLTVMLDTLVFACIPYTIGFIRMKFMPLKLAPNLVGLEISTIDDIAGSKEKLLQDIHNASHLQGAYTVKIRPWSSAKMNEEGRVFCVPVSTPMPNSNGLSEAIRRPINADVGAPTKIPLTIRGNGPWTVTILRNQKAYKEFSVKSEEKSSSFALLEFEIDQDGSYSLGKLIDGNGSEGKIEREPVEVISCPQLRLDGLLVKNGIEMCNDAVFPLKVWLKGHPPFVLAFDVVSDDGIEHITVTEAIPSSTQMSGFNLFVYNLDIRSIRTKAMQFLLRVASIQDGTGRVHKYGLWDNGDATLVETFSPPKVTWWLEPAKPPKILDDGKSIDLPIQLKGKSPFEFMVLGPDGKTIAFKDIHDHRASVAASLPGPYRLMSVRDSLCKGKIDIRDEISVQIAHPPTLNITSSPIKGPCKGDMGLNFVFLMTEEGPWKIFAKQKLESSSQVKTKDLIISASAPRLEYSWKPELPGKYHLEFVGIADTNYDYVVLDGFKYDQYINPAPSAIFISEGDSFFTCVTRSLDVKIRFSGLGPWLLEYSMVSSDKNVHNLKFEADQNEVTVKLNDFAVGGRYTISLVSVTDASGCVASVASQSRVITVFEHLPTFEFLEEKAILREGFQDLVPIKVRANGLPIQLNVSYELVGSDPKIIPITIDHNTNGLALNAPGKWSVVQFRDKYCIGKIVPGKGSSFVAILSKPTVAFVDGVPEWTSRANSTSSTPSVTVFGTDHISLTYTIQYAHDETKLDVSTKERKVVTGVTGQRLLLLTGKSSPTPGFYRFELISVSDSAFPELPLQDMLFIQQVLPDPAPRIASAQRTIAYCYDRLKTSIGPFVIDFTGSELPGVFPIRVKYELFAKNNVQLTSQVTVGKDRLFQIDGINEPGSYHLRIVQVENQLGGIWEVSSKASLGTQIKEQSTLPIDLVERPSFELSTQKPCVGDIVHFRLFGTGPWTLKYRLKNKVKVDTVSNNGLSVLLAEAGPFVIESLCNKYCCASLLETVEYMVHPLPSASISEGIQYVREGEEAEFVVSLKGTPPFSYSYQRIDESNGHIVDTFSHHNITSNEHQVKVFSQGTFKVIFVQDQYCQYPKKAEK